MPQFSLSTYLLVIVSIISFYPFGKRLGVKPFFAASLAGTCLIGLAVALFANFCAGLIRPFLLLVIAVGLCLTVSDLRHLRHNFWKKIKPLYVFLALIGLVLIIANSPSRVFIDQRDDKTLLLFNSHYSYFSSQSTEMLNARYYDRLKVSNLYPYEWTRYHFFNSAARASSMGLIKNPGLFSYWIAQTILSVLVLLAFAEVLLLSYGFKARNVLMFFVWLGIGFTLFSDSLTWNFITTGLFSVFAMVLFLISAHSRNWRQATIFLFILGASAFRLLPITLLSLALLIYYFAKTNTTEKISLKIGRVYSQIKRLNLSPLDYVALLLFAAYNGATLIAAKNSPLDEQYTLLAREIFSHGWLYSLSFYRFWGFVNHYLLHGYQYFISYNATGFFDKTMASPFKIRIFIWIARALILFWVVSFLRNAVEHIKASSWFFVLIGIIYLEISFISQDLVALYTLMASYFLAALVLLHSIRKKTDKDGALLTAFALFFVVSTFLFLHSGLPPSIKGPVAYVTFDVALWALIGIFLFTFLYKKWVVASSFGLAILLMLTLNPSFFSMLAMSSRDNHYAEVDITALRSKDFKRSDYVDNKNFMTFHSVDSITADAYSAIMGGNYEYSSAHASFLNNTFISKETNEER